MDDDFNEIITGEWLKSSQVLENLVKDEMPGVLADYRKQAERITSMWMDAAPLLDEVAKYEAEALQLDEDRRGREIEWRKYVAEQAFHAVKAARAATVLFAHAQEVASQDWESWDPEPWR